MIHAFKIYYKPVFQYLLEVFAINKLNTYLTLITGFILSFWQLNIFGVPNILIVLVFLTIVANTYTGIKKSKIKAIRALRCMRKMGCKEMGSDKYNTCKKIYHDNKFDRKKLSFVYFKVFTFLGYLYFANTLLTTDSDNYFEVALSFTSGLLLKVPTAWFWYTEWKSIGDNAVIIYGQKPKIFDITANIFEAKIIKLFK